MVELFNILDIALLLYSYALIVYILMSWFPGAQDSTFGQLLARIAEPFLEPFRRMIPNLGMIDFSPIVAIFAIHMARMGLLELFKMLVF